MRVIKGGLAVDVHSTLGTLLVIAVVAVLAPVCLALLPGPRIPQVVLLLLGGMLVGPQGLRLGSPESVQILADVGLGFLFLLAGYEVDQRLLRADAGRRAALSWLVTAVLAGGVVALLYGVGLVRAFVPVAIALTTTALGTLLPILRENHLLRGPLGSHLLASGAVGELLPIIAVAVFLGTTNRWVALISLAAVTAVAFGLTFLSRWFRIGRIRTFIEEGEHETTQVTIRGTVLLLTLLLAVTEQFHLDAVLGAFLAGMVLRRWAGRGLPSLEGKLDALGYGFFIPIFFVYSGMTMDLRSMASAPLRVLLFTTLMLLVHVVPAQLLYRKVLDPRERWQLALITSTALPLLVAISEISRRNGTMLPANAAALVGAGVLTVLVFPAVAVVLRRPPIVSDAPVP
ncbi:MAG: cation:proton antiporter [Pseudonocardia sp.]|nr:cation:proton antiporter [Pseudonocardia sp.]